MNSQGMNGDREQLSQEERVLAERVARLGQHGEPSPALDARILAAAHAAATAPDLAQRRRSRRWPAALGIAASLALAVGIAWQVRPLTESERYDEAASSVASQPGASAAQQSAAVPESPPADTAPRADQGNAAASAPARRREATKPILPPAEREPAPAPAAPRAEEPVVVLDEVTAPTDTAAPAEAPAATTMQAPPPPASPAAKAAAASADRQTESAERSTGNTAAEVAAQAREDAVAEDVPPATVDSPEVRDAWLQRIRELVKSGKADDARASLREFVHRYPEFPLPEDLNALLD